MTTPSLPTVAPSLVPPGLCTLLEPDVVWLHLISDLGIGLAYLSIPAAILVFALRRRDLAYPWVLLLFAAFIISCGATHLMHAWTMFYPDYIREGLIKAFTAAVSIATAITLWPLLPRLLALPSPAALAREVEERRAAESRARGSEARMAAFIDHLAEALFVVRVLPDGRFVTETVNPAYESLFGASAAAVVGRDAEEALAPDIAARILPHWRAAAGTAAVQQYEVEAETPGGLRCWQTVLVPMAGADGRVERLLGSARDVSQTRRLQAGLIQSARLATIGTMCAGLAHEASQPLNAALLWLRHARTAAERLASGQADRNAGSDSPSSEGATRLRSAFGIVDSQLRRAGDLLGRIRGLAVADDDSRAEPFDPVPTAAATVRTAASQYGPEGIAVTFTHPQETMLVQGLPSRLEQGLLQLLANARDAILERRAKEPEAPATITVSLSRKGREALLEVRDTGLGVPEAMREVIFDPFFTTKEPGQGSGLGLSLAAAIVRGMGGRIEARTLPEGGASFLMSLALTPPPSHEPHPAVAC